MPFPDTVKKAAGELGVHEVEVEPAGGLESPADRGLGNLRERDAPKAVGGAAEQLGEMPRDGLALAVEIGREVDDAVRTGLAQLGDGALLVRGNGPDGAPAGGDIDAESRAAARARRALAAAARGRPRTPAIGQVADMAERRANEVAAAEKRVDLAGLARRLDDDQ